VHKCDYESDQHYRPYWGIHYGALDYLYLDVLYFANAVSRTESVAVDVWESLMKFLLVRVHLEKKKR
jgi:hypothetical protein